VTKEIGSNTLMGYGFKVAKGVPATSKQGAKNTLSPYSWFIYR